jgi:two-component system NtrC family response regulator
MRVLVVEDDADVRRFAERALSRAGHDVHAVASAEEGLAALPGFEPALLLTDVRLEGMDGLELLGIARRLRPELPVLVMTSFGSIESAVEAMRGGASDYLTKPLTVDDLLLRVERAARVRRLETENRWLRNELAGTFAPGRIVAVAPGMRRLMAIIDKLALSGASVLLTGESGTGKDLLARALHFGGPRAAGPLIAVNCAALPGGLVESELFGHVRGAFTGAAGDRIGKLEAAHKGTLFLDEVAELPLDVQPKLLRALEERAFERVGDNRVRRVDVRVVAATNRDLRALVSQERFREDLYFRLAVVPVNVPALRERREDVPALARHLLARFGGPEAPELTDAALDWLQAQSWPGNVRELANLIECTLALHEAGPIDADDLRRHRQMVTAAGLPQEAEHSTDAAAPGAGTLDGAVRALLVEALERCGWNQSAAARALGVPRHVLQYRMVKYRIDAPARSAAPRGTAR